LSCLDPSGALNRGPRTGQYDLLISWLGQVRDVATPVIIAQPAFRNSPAIPDPAVDGDRG